MATPLVLRIALPMIATAIIGLMVTRAVSAIAGFLVALLSLRCSLNPNPVDATQLFVNVSVCLLNVNKRYHGE